MCMGNSSSFPHIVADIEVKGFLVGDINYLWSSVIHYENSNHDLQKK